MNKLTRCLTALLFLAALSSLAPASGTSRVGGQTYSTTGGVDTAPVQDLAGEVTLYIGRETFSI